VTGWTNLRTLGEARDHVRREIRLEGTHCPCCGQFARIYRRSITSPMVRGLVTMLRTEPVQPFHLPTVLGHVAGDHAKLRYWGLLTELEEVREDGGRAGWYRFTDLGRDFLLRGARVPRWALVYDSRLLGLDGPPVTAADCLGRGFDLRELLGTLAGDVEVSAP